MVGTKLGPGYANLFVGYIENEFFSNYDGPKPGLYKCFIDDCVGATLSSREELSQFITSVNSFHPALKYTWEISENSLVFLDIKLSVNDNGLSTSVHYVLSSTTASKMSFHSLNCNFLIRLRHLCSDDSEFNSKCEEMCQCFKKRDYPDSTLTTGKHRAQEID